MRRRKLNAGQYERATSINTSRRTPALEVDESGVPGLRNDAFRVRPIMHPEDCYGGDDFEGAGDGE